MRRMILIFLLSVCLKPALSQWSTVPNENLQLTERGLVPKMVSDDAGGAYILYKDFPLEAVNLFVLRVDKYGNKIFPDYGIPVTDYEHKQDNIYFLIKDEQGGAIIVFDDIKFIKDTFTCQIRAQRIDSIGTKLWGVNGVAVSPQNEKGVVAISTCADGSGGCYVFWKIKYNRTHVELYAQHLDGRGNFLWDSTGVLITDQFVSHEWPVPCLTAGDADGGVICYFNDSTGVKLHRLNSNGEFLWGDGVSIFQMGGFPNMQSDGTGGVVIAGSYLSEDDGGSGTRYNVGAQRVAQNGQVLWGDQGVILTDLADDRTFIPEIITAINGYNIFFWQDKHSGDSDIYAQSVNMNGELRWEMNGVNVSLIKSKKFFNNTQIAKAKKIGAIIAWYDFRFHTDGAYWDDVAIYCQKINSEGKSAWGEDVVIAGRENASRASFNDLKVISDNNGGAIACWYGLYTESGIWVQQISRNGNLGEVLKPMTVPDNPVTRPLTTAIFDGYPNPFNLQISFKYILGTRSRMQIRIFNLHGNEVKKLLNEFQDQGEYQIDWNGQDQHDNALPSGVYFLQFMAEKFHQTLKIVLLK